MTRKARPVALTLLVALSSLLVLSKATADTEPVQISRTPAPSRTFEAPAVALDPTDPDLVYVAASDIQAGTCHLYASGDGGRRFRELDGPDFGSFSYCGLSKGNALPKNIRMKLAVDREGVLYWVVAAAHPAAQGGLSVILARSEDRGGSFQTTVVARAPIPATPEEAVANFVPDLFVSPFGGRPRTVWVSWRRSFSSNSNRPTESWAARSDDGGRTFGTEVRAMARDPGFDAPRVLMDERGRVYWFQRERPPRAAEGEQSRPSPLLMATSDDGGRTWQEQNLGQAQTVMEEPLAGVSPDGGTLYLAWADTRNGDLDVLFMRSTDRGRTWSSPVRVNDDGMGNRRSQKWPKLTVAPGGRVEVAWYDYRNDDKPTPEDDLEFFLGDRNDVYAASSDDGGRTFSDNRRVTDRSVDRRIGTYNAGYSVEVPPGVGVADDRGFYAWSDTRLGGADSSAQDVFGKAATIDDGVSWGLLLIAAEVALIALGVVLLVAAALRRRNSTT